MGDVAAINVAQTLLSVSLLELEALEAQTGVSVPHSLREIQRVADLHSAGPDDRGVDAGAVVVDPHGGLEQARIGDAGVGIEIEHRAADDARADRDGRRCRSFSAPYRPS